MPARINVVQRADSFRSERSDASAANKRVSFQPRVDVKHVQQPQQQAFPTVYKEPTSLNEAELAKEAERIIKQVDQISCTVSPNPVLAGRLPVYETRSLERTSKKNNRQAQQQQQQQHHPEVVNSWKTLPTATKSNLLLDKQNSSKNKQSSKNNSGLQLEKSINQQVALNNQNLHQPVAETTNPPIRKQPDMHTTPPKYDSGIEMEAGGSLNRPNVNLIVQQLTEEARQRELIRRQYQEELLRLAGEAAEVDQMPADPLAPRLPALNLIEPDPQFGVAHNRNLPFSYTGGASPTRLSPLRSSALRFPSPPRQQPAQQQPQNDAAVYAHVNPDRHQLKQQRSQSPERTNNLFDRGSADKVPDKLNFHQSDMRQHSRNREEELMDNNTMDRAKARFLFGDDGRNNNNDRFNSLPKGSENGQRYTTKIVIGDDRPAHQRIIHSSSYDEEYERKRRAYEDRSVSPEPCALPVATQVRTLERQMKDEQARYPPQQKPQRLASTRLIQEAERGRTSFRTPRNQTHQMPSQQQQQQQFVNNSSRLVRQVSNGGKYPPPVIRTEIHDLGAGTPKPPVRSKKLSRERVRSGSPPSNKNSGGKVLFGKPKTVPWMPDASPESSPERFIPSYHQSSKSTNVYRGYGDHQQPRSISPSPERVVIINNNKNSNTKAHPAEPEKQEKIRRQRNKFLSVFLGSKASKTTTTSSNGNNNNNNNSSGSSVDKPIRVVHQHHHQQGPPPVSRWTDDEVDFARRPSTRQPTTKAHQYRVIHHHSSKDPSRRRESSYTDRTDTSESDEVHRQGQQQRFKNQRQKSQSYNNLNYRPDPAVILPEEAPPRVSKQYDAKPYASTNIIRQAEIRQEEEHRGTTTNTTSSSRPVRYFGDTDLESQPSRNYNSGGGGTRYVPRAKVTRSSSTAAGVGAVRRGVMQRNNNGHHNNKQPLSSVNSSESDGSAAMQSGASAESQRSVYLHATTCADIPTVVPVNKLQQARLRAKSREDMSALSGHSGSTLRQSRHISRSYSVLAPWKPRHYRDKYEINYTNQQVGGQPNRGDGQPVSSANDVGKPPRIPRARNPSAHRGDENVILEDCEPNQPAPPMVVRSAHQTSGGSKTANFVARSASMPKGGNSGGGGNRVAGWFRSKKKQPR